MAIDKAAAANDRAGRRSRRVARRSAPARSSPAAVDPKSQVRDRSASYFAWESPSARPPGEARSATRAPARQRPARPARPAVREPPAIRAPAASAADPTVPSRRRSKARDQRRPLRIATGAAHGSMYEGRLEAMSEKKRTVRQSQIAA